MDNAGHPPVWHRAGAFAFVGPDWTGEPAEVRAVRSNTPFVLAFLRILVNGEDDLPAVAALQQRFTVTTLPAGLGSPGAGGDAASLPTCDAADARGFFRTLRRLLALMPVPAGEAGVHAGFDPIGIGPGGSDKALDAVPAEVLKAGLARGKRIAEAGRLRFGAPVNFLRIARDGIGTYGYDYLQWRNDAVESAIVAVVKPRRNMPSNA